MNIQIKGPCSLTLFGYKPYLRKSLILKIQRSNETVAYFDQLNLECYSLLYVYSKLHNKCRYLYRVWQINARIYLCLWSVGRR